MSTVTTERVSFIPTSEEKKKMRAIREYSGITATTELIRYCITQTYNQINSEE